MGDEPVADIGLPEPTRIVREVTFEQGDGRTIEARVIPYNVAAKVLDLPEHGGTGVPYLERWLPGAFEKQTGAANRVPVLLNVEHERGFGSVVGHGTELREEPDALYATFRMLPGPDGDKALHMVNEGILDGLSVEAIPTRSIRGAGTVDRVKARLDRVALCRGALSAYSEARVLAVREAPPEGPETIPAEPVVRNSEVDELLVRVGYAPLVRQAIVTSTWDGSASRFTDDEFLRACLIDKGGDGPVKQRCLLPVLEPNGDLNQNALREAAIVLSSGRRNLSSDEKAAAARKLIRYYRQAEMTPSESLRAIAAQ